MDQIRTRRLLFSRSPKKENFSAKEFSATLVLRSDEGVFTQGFKGLVVFRKGILACVV